MVEDIAVLPRMMTLGAEGAPLPTDGVLKLLSRLIIVVISFVFSIVRAKRNLVTTSLWDE